MTYRVPIIRICIVQIYVLICIYFFCFPAFGNNCDICRGALNKYRSSFHEINAETSLGGGNTAWEEKFIGRYALSELHALETLEKTLESLSSDEALLISDIEHDIEKFWSANLKPGHSELDDIVDFFCVEKLRLCCPWKKYGFNCSDCELCNIENGHCDGNGTRTGTGKCQCRVGFAGDSCDLCDQLTHFESFSETKGLICIPCHASCAGGCLDATPASCVSCAEGFVSIEKNSNKVCEDVDECKDGNSFCSLGTYCNNTKGSFSCVSCPIGCASCENPSKCLSCSSGYSLLGGRCVDIDECSAFNVCSGPHQRCINRPGSFHCVCTKGYRLIKGECVAKSSSREARHRHSNNSWSSRKTKRLLGEFSKLLFILFSSGLSLYLFSTHLIICASVAAFAVGFIYYQANVLDTVYLTM